MKNYILKIEENIVKIEKFLLVVFVILMIILSFYQLILRLFFHSGIIWMDIFLRYLVLNTAMISAALVTYYKKHFAMDAIFNFIDKKWHKKMKIISNTFVLIISFFLIISAYKFVREEFINSSIAFTIGNINIKAFIFQISIPISFLILILALAFISTPVFSLISALTFFLFYKDNIDISAAIIELMRLSSLPSLIAIPLFIFSGYILAYSKAPQRIFNLANSLFGFIIGCIAIASLMAAAIFTAFTGASAITIIALGGLIYPILIKQGYTEKFSLGLITTTGSLGLLFPPSLPIILYAIVGKLDLNLLFKSALLPAIFLIIILSFYSFYSAKKFKIQKEKFDILKLKESIKATIWEIPLPFIIIGGIYKGIFTASEAASIMAFYVIIVEVFIYKDLNFFKDIPKILIKSMMLVGAIFMVLGTALGFTNYIIDAQLPDKLFNWLNSYISNKTLFLLILNIFLLLINMIEIFSAIIIVVPIIVPVAINYGIDPYHLGIIFLLNLELGYMTPPLGLNLFLSSMRFEKPLTQIYKNVWIYWLIVFSTLILITYFPTLILIK